MGYILLINVVYWGYNPFTIHLPTSWDIQAWPIMFLPEPAIFNPPLVTPKGLNLNTYDVMFWDTPGQTISNDLSLCQLNGANFTHTIYVWCIYLHSVDFYGKCR